MSLHGNPITATTALPDGREARIRVGIAEDGYVADRDLDTVVLQVSVDHEVAAVIDTILDAAHVDEARHLVARVRDGLAAGDLEPTVTSLEPLADSLL
jgi:hypothetical protein